MQKEVLGEEIDQQIVWPAGKPPAKDARLTQRQGGKSEFEPRSLGYIYIIYIIYIYNIYIYDDH